MAAGSINPIPAGNVSYTSGATDRVECGRSRSEIRGKRTQHATAKDVFMSGGAAALPLFGSRLLFFRFVLFFSRL